MKTLMQTLAISLVIAAGGRFTVAWQQLGGHPYGGASIQENLACGFISLVIGLDFLQSLSMNNHE